MTPNSIFSIKEAEVLLLQYNQQELLEIVLNLTPSSLSIILKQLHKISFSLNNQKLTPTLQNQKEASSLTPLTSPSQESFTHIPLAKNALQKGEIGAIILAGGDGSRLNFNHPKGCFPVSIFSKKSLFQLHCEKIEALQKKLNCYLPLIILTSDTNHDETESFFKKFNYFNLKPSLLFFLKQPQFPLYTKTNKWFFNSPERISTGPNGNGSIFETLTPFIKDFPDLNHFMIINVDNPLASPYDLSLISNHLFSKSDVSLRCYKKSVVNDNVGVFVYKNNKLSIIDYSQIDNSASFPYGNMNIFCLTANFIKKINNLNLLPIHWIEKKGKQYNFITKKYEEVSFLKGEKFITDAIFYADKAMVINSLVEDHFSPLKNATGYNDLTSVQQALLKKDKKIYSLLRGELPLEPFFELDPNLYYEKN